MTARRIVRIVENAARNFVRKCKRRGIRLWWVNNCGNEGRIVYAMQNPFSRGLGLTGPDLDVERSTFFIPRQYDPSGELLFPITKNDGTEDLGISSRIWFGEKLYEVQLVTGDAEGMAETAVFKCHCIYRMYNPFVGSWTPPPDEDNIMIWHRINAGQTAEKNNGYFIDASTAPVNLVLPNTPAIGWQVGVRAMDITNAITIIATGGLKIEGTDELTIDIVNAGFTLTYSQDVRGWCVTTEV